MKSFLLRLAKNFLPALKKYIPLFFKKVLGLISIKNLLIVAAIIGIALLIYYGFGGGIGGGKGEGEGNGNTVNSETQEDENTEKDGNEDDYEGAIFSVTVAGNDYFFNNERIKLEDLMEKLETVEGAFVVEIKDDNASLKAYNNLIDRLDNANMRFIEK